MITTNLTDLIDDALGRTDREVDDIDRGWLRRIATIIVRNLWAKCARLNRDRFTKTSASWAIASGNTHTIGTGDSVTDYLSFRGLEYDVGGGVYKPLRPYRFADRGWPGALSYRVFNRTIDIQPIELATTFTFRFKYVYQPTFADEKDPFDLPLGGDDWAAEGIAAKIRNRFEEPPEDHLTAQAIALQTVTGFLCSDDQGPPEQIPEAGDFPDVQGGW